MDTKEVKVPSTFRKALNILLNIGITFFSCILLILLFINFQTMFLDKSYNDVFGYSFFEITTGSMSPEIEIGDWIIVEIDNENIDINDIITYQEGEAFVTHRVTAIYGDVIQTKGDANNTSDASITRSQVIGKMVKILPRFGIIKKLFLNPKLLVLFIVIMIVLCSIVDSSFDQRFIQFFKEKSSNNKEKLKEAISIKKVQLEEDKVKKEQEKIKKEELKKVQIAQEAIRKQVEEEEKARQKLEAETLHSYKLELENEPKQEKLDDDLKINLKKEEEKKEEPLSQTTLLSNLSVEVQNHRVINLDEKKTKK